MASTESQNKPISKHLVCANFLNGNLRILNYSYRIQMANTASYRNRVPRKYQVNQEQEAELMTRYTKTATRELVFAVDLMDFVLSLSNIRLQKGHCIDSRGSLDFNEDVRNFVEQSLPYKLKAGAKRAMESNLKLDQFSYDEFKSFVNGSAIRAEEVPHGKSREYATYMYMVFCVMMSEMCTIAYQRGVPEAPKFGIMLMCRTFSNFCIKSALPPNPWQSMKIVAKEPIDKLEIRFRSDE